MVVGMKVACCLQQCVLLAVQGASQEDTQRDESIFQVPESGC